MLGEDTSLPIFISPAGMAGLAHPLAEKGLAKAAGVCGIIQMVSRQAETHERLFFLVSTWESGGKTDVKVSTNASAPLDSIVAAGKATQSFFMQLYVDRNRPKTEKLLGVINGFVGMKGIFVTVDAAAPGKREADERSRAEIEVVSWQIRGCLAVPSISQSLDCSPFGFVKAIKCFNCETMGWDYGTKPMSESR